jgi:hypothetical protein
MLYLNLLEVKLHLISLSNMKSSANLMFDIFFDRYRIFFIVVSIYSRAKLSS